MFSRDANMSVIINLTLLFQVPILWGLICIYPAKPVQGAKSFDAHPNLFQDNVPKEAKPSSQHPGITANISGLQLSSLMGSDGIVINWV